MTAAGKTAVRNTRTCGKYPAPRGIEPQNCQPRKMRRSLPPPSWQNTEHLHLHTCALTSCLTRVHTRRHTETLVCPRGLPHRPAGTPLSRFIHTPLSTQTCGPRGQDAPWLRAGSGWGLFPASLTLDTNDCKHSVKGLPVQKVNNRIN